MKALILANLRKIHYSKGEVIPSCFLSLYNEMTILERQISLLNVNGFTQDDICVLFGQKGVWEFKSVKERIDKIDTVKIFSEKNEMLCADIFHHEFFKQDQEYFFIEGNQVFDIAILSRLNRYRKKNVLVTNQHINPDELKYEIELEDKKIISISDAALMKFPWISFAGVAKFSYDIIRKFKKIVIAPMSFLDAVNSVANNTEIVAIGYDELLYGRLNGGHSNELTGGSYSKLNYRLVVKKENEGAGREKLINEIKWLLDLPLELKPYFSNVLEYDIKSEKVFFNVPYYGSRNLREYIFDGHYDADAAICFLKKLLDWMFQNVYNRKISTASSKWVLEKHIKRVLDRLLEISEKSNTLKRLVNAEYLQINGKKYRNIQDLFEQLSYRTDILEKINPKELVMIHGDLHFQNILVYSENDLGFILVDPRGELDGSDLYYDIGKLYHSFHGKYDFIHSDQFQLDLHWNENIPLASYDITNKYIANIYEKIYERFFDLIRQYAPIRNDPDWEMKALFAEAAHFCSVSTFHVEKTKKDNRAVVLYLIGVKLINEFFDKYIEENHESDDIEL